MKYSKIALNTLFSTWVWIWAILYYLTIRFSLPSPLPLDKWNPVAALILALSYQLFVFFYDILIQGPNLVKVLPIILLIAFVFKAGPLYLLWTPDIPWRNSIIAGTVLFVIYYAYIRAKDLTVWGLYSTLTEILIQDKIRERIVL